MNTTVSSVNKIKKLQVQATIEFAIANIPGADRNTLEKLSELINATGNFGPISETEITDKMNLILKYIPSASLWSLKAVAELLDIRFPRPAVNFEQPKVIPLPLEPRMSSAAARVH